MAFTGEDAAPQPDTPGSPRSGVVRLRAVGCTEVTTATGFYVEGLGVITNRHVVSGAQRIDAETWDGLAVTTDGAAAQDTVDVAVVALRPATDPHQGANLQGLSLQALPPEAGSPIRVLGFPRGRQYEDHLGTVLGRADDGNGNAVLVLDVAAEPGNSGSPVIDAAGKVVGVVYARRTDSGQILAVPAARLSRIGAELAVRGAPFTTQSCSPGA